MVSRRPPTIIIFSREAMPNRTKTRLAAKLGAHNAAALAHAFTLDALQKTRRLGSHHLVIAGSALKPVQHSAYFQRLARRFGAELVDQGEGSLGVRMARALGLFQADGAVLIGTDTPSLPPKLLARSLDLLRHVPVVLGPSLDGGYYLVGVRGILPDIFRGIRWGGRQVLAQTLARLDRDGLAYRLGPSWYDVDRWADLMLLSEHLRLVLTRNALSGRQGTGRGGQHLRQGTNPCPHTAQVLARLGLLDAAR